MARRKLWKGCYFKILVCATVVFIFWTVVGYLFTFHDEDFPEDVMYDVFIDETREDHKHIPLDQEIMEELRKLDLKRQNGGGSEDGLPLQDPSDPIIMWWTEFTREPGITRDCGDNSCFFTNNRKYRDHKNMKVFMFYGTDFSPDDLPLPRADNHEWALFHEESPKNNYILCHEPVISLFNYTSTFRRESHFPISTQHLLSLDWLLQSTYTKTVAEKNRYQEEEGLALIVYVQSDCDPPSDRDEYVKQLMKHISVDSYGGCLNNRKLPQQIAAPLEGMAHKEFFELLSRYKFALAMENAVCNDYMTEKMWRPLMVGAVPIIFGSSKVKDFLPSNKSALLLQEFKSPEHLAMVIKNLNENEVEYEKLRKWKTSGISNTFLFDTMSSRTWAPDDEENWIPGHTNFVEGFECYVCNKVHDNMKRQHNGQNIKKQWGKKSHYGCPRPAKFDEFGRYGKAPGWLDFWSSQWEQHGAMAGNLKQCVLQGKTDCKEDTVGSKAKGDF